MDRATIEMIYSMRKGMQHWNVVLKDPGISLPMRIDVDSEKMTLFVGENSASCFSIPFREALGAFLKP